MYAKAETNGSGGADRPAGYPQTNLPLRFPWAFRFSGVDLIRDFVILIPATEIPLNNMKKDIHPKYFTDTKVTCACGNSFVVGSTQKEITVDICSKCHPFYTGEQKLVDTAGRVEKFTTRRSKAGTAKPKKIRVKKTKVINQADGISKPAKKAAKKKTVK